MRVGVSRAFLVIAVFSVAGVFAAWYLYLQFFTVTCRNVSVAEAKALMESTSSLLIVDVRSEEEYGQGHLKGAINIPSSDLPSRVGELDVNSMILVYCQSGRRSAQACLFLVERGFTRVYSMEGGIDEWMKSGYPIVTEKVVLASWFVWVPPVGGG